MLSVIIPCHDNQHTLRWILRALRGSELPGLEILCVDDASTRPLAPITEQFGARLIRLDGPPGRRALARNLGHEASTNPLSLYLDGDVIPDIHLPWVAVELHRLHAGVAVKYPVYGIPQNLSRERLADVASLVLQGDRIGLGKLVTKPLSIDTRPLPRRLRGRRTTVWQLCASHCLSVERKHVAHIGGWDPAFVGWGEEDMEFAYRLHSSGIAFLYPHRRLVAAYHVDHPVDWDRNLASLRRNLAYFQGKYPDGCRARLPLLRYYLRELRKWDEWVVGDNANS